MKKFDLEAALAGASVVTRRGDKVLQIAYFSVPSLFPVMAAVEGMEDVASFMVNGRYIKSRESDTDLFMATEKKQGFINIYPPNVPSLGNYITAYDQEFPVVKIVTESGTIVRSSATVQTEAEVKI
jgi:hypothetical protein